MFLVDSLFIFATITVSSFPALWGNFITFFQILALIENRVNSFLKTSKSFLYSSHVKRLMKLLINPYVS